ncbi:hypothetical protein LCGC14_1357110 [marine sediment metagenome]|uniref:Peptidase S8/S53 domain-containing protein n=1 Tax=marine sediment metagenome TaxID=412755 RepID=A0A0F9K956_9ZZZZ
MNNYLKVTVPNLTPDLFVLQTFSEVYDWGLRDLHIPEIHKQTMGEGIKIAVVDSGKSEHFELKDNTINAKNFTKSSTVNDLNGHSSVVSGIIAAAKNNEGIIGVAPKSKILFAKAIDDGGTGGPSMLVNAINWSISQQVDIISVSAGLFMDFKPLHKVIQKAYRKNIIIVSAVGNTSNRHYDVAFPARYPEVIGVAAYDVRHTVARFSSRGVNVSFAAAGVDVYSTWLNNQYSKHSGTSFSAPLITGICSLILSKHRQLGNQSKTPCETPQQMLEHLKKYAIKLGDKKETGFGTIDTRSMFAKGM